MAANTASLIDRFITPGSPLAKAGGARLLLKVTGGNVAGAAALAAIAKNESEFGRTAGKFKNNYWGWGVHLGPSVYTSPSVEAGAAKVWKGLNSGLYKGAGINTLPAIIQKYAPPSENNTGLYKKQVSSWMQQLGVGPNTNIFNGSGGQAPADAGAVPPAAPASLPQEVAGQLDVGRLKMLLGNQTKRSLRGIMPAEGFRGELQKLAQQSLPRAVAVEGAVQTVGQVADRSSAQAINAAKNVVGTPYSWGGGTPDGPSRGFGRGANTIGFDCSSLVQMAWAKAGITLPRTTYDQIKVGKQISTGSPKSWQPGDLLFPSTGHVQMYLGNGKVIEAPRTGGRVQIVPVRSKYIAVRRPQP
jgi:cell wall-associated NlpC family hydrolase